MITDNACKQVISSIKIVWSMKRAYTERFINEKIVDRKRKKL